jgi:hypothetical protein
MPWLSAIHHQSLCGTRVLIVACAVVITAAGMEVVPLEAAQQMRAGGQFLVHQEVLGHIYGITAAAVRKLQAMGKLPLLDLDRVQDVEQLKAAGFQVRASSCWAGIAPETSCRWLHVPADVRVL